MKTKLKAWYMLCPVRHILLLPGYGCILLHLLLRRNYALMNRLSKGVIRPVHRALAGLCNYFRFSVAELLIALLVLAAAGYLLVQLVRLIRRGERLKRLYRLLVTAAAAFGLIYGGFCLLWGVYYYGDDFCTAAGLSQEPVAVEDLKAVTAYFAALANEGATAVQRDESGLYTADRDVILEKSATVFTAAETEFPCLAGDPIRAKGIKASVIMSYTDFTGFFFPFTAEANVNTDFPVPLFASTVAHELSHQRGVAKEQEANFTAVLACMSCADADYAYSGALLAYTYLGNALYSADKDAWREVYGTLNEDVLRDLTANKTYWARFETPVQTVSNTVYEGFLQSYDQTLGLKSYGACVDLLVNYYKNAATAWICR